MECRITGSRRLTPLLGLGKHPVSHHFLRRLDEERATYPFDLFYCEDSGLIQLRDVIPAGELYGEYFNLSSSKRCPHIPRLLGMVAEAIGMRRRPRILEIGCNDGHFLVALRAIGYGNLVGVEPAHDAWEASVNRGITVLNRYFDREAALKLRTTHPNFDLVIARHVIEHVSDLEGFFSALTSLLRPSGFVLLEVPDFGFCMRHLDYTALWEQHLNYFSLDTFRLLLARHGIELLRHGRARFSGQALIVLGRYTGRRIPSSNSYLGRHRRLAMNYRDKWPAFKRLLRGWLSRRRHADAIPLYGAGCRTCSLVNFTGIADLIDYFVDDQPKKLGLYMPGSRLPIFSRSKLHDDNVRVCLLGVNAENERAVMAAIRGDGLRGMRYWSIHPPSDLLPPFWKAMAQSQA